MATELGVEVKVSLHEPELTWFALSAPTKHGYLNNQIRVYCVPSKVKAKCD